VDGPVPNFIMWGLGYPANLQSRLLAPYADRVDFRTSAVDTLMIADTDGTVGPAVIPATRHAEPGPRDFCGWEIFRRPTEIPLDGPVAFGGWWVRIHYLAAAQTPATVTAGSATYDVILPFGEHDLYVAADGEFDSISLARSTRGATLCTDDITVGRPVPTGTEPDQARPEQAQPEDTP
jgi:hypothetical protein